ncbi:zinc finger protein with KRAB and SCAN domains 8-like isoform X2 [Lacerta agilis]|uniref:zinc finger protein with KRAB and SCAN domains 8-like isoform X2 n=1 Tax=Lacerta agilis TaxID=80427 RepID=UPI00141A65A3|nr:zinc finger protein with KRAB and SCAN domains 8-like isoform X2 [Lacerta agilis]
MEPEIKMEEQSWSPEFGDQRSIRPKTGRLKEVLLGEAQQNVKQEPNDDPSRNWDAQLQEFLKMLQDSHSGEGNPQVPETRDWDNPKVLEVTSEGVTGDHSWPRVLWASQIQPHLAGEAQEDHETNLNAIPSGKEKARTPSGDGAEMERQRRCFRELCYQEADGPYKLFRQLQACCHQWLKPERHTKEQILELVTLEQFLAALPQEMQSWVRERNPGSCAWAVTLAEEFLLSQKEVNSWEGQITGMSEKELVNPHEAEQALPGMVKMQLSTWPKQGDEESVSLLAGDRRLSESKGQKRLRESPEQTELQKTTLKAGQEKDYLCQGEADKDRRRAETQKRNDTKKAADPFIIQQGVCKDAAQQHEENDMEYDTGGEICGQKAHGSTDEGIPTEETPYKCWQCGRSFSSSSDLLIHERSHVGEKLYKCSHCGKRETIQTGQTAHKCSQCGKNFDWIPQVRPRGREERYSCTECEKSYTSKSFLLKHQQLHRGEKPYKCCFCPEAYTNWWELKAHRQTHRGDTPHKPYKCSHCGMIFLWNSQLLSREGSHTAFCCYCGKGFMQNSELVEHEKTHAAEEPLACFICGENFGVSAELLAHVQKHRENPLQCSVCGEVFKNSL